MGLIKKIFGGLFAFLGNLLGGLVGLFGIGKGSGFYMELEEGETATPPAAPPVETALGNEAGAAAPATEIATRPQQQSIDPGSTKSAPEAVAAPYVEPKRPLVLPRTEAELKAQAPAGDLKTFATDFLLSPRTGRSSRRRPGPSISPFKDMAKQIGRQSASMG